MARKKQSQKILAEVRRDRLYKHLNEVEEVIQEWITDLSTVPPPFFWQPSEESEKFSKPSGFTPVRPPDYYRLQPWKLWACQSTYMTHAEQDIASNHMLHKHLRKRALWTYHTEWGQKLNAIRELSIPICDRATEMGNERAKGKELTEDYKAVALLVALELALGHTPEKSYLQKGSQGVCYAYEAVEVVIEKSANTQQMKGEVEEEHWQMILELSQSKEMLELAQEWQQALVLQGRMIELAQKAIKSSDILYPCQFCRRLWQE